ncbi:MAG TPA: hypothetical protein VNO32_06190 [Candidatus Acidoferrum sp.]|nr:hypothetical protein [Candidatus Acidoferrum sp.]
MFGIDFRNYDNLWQSGGWLSPVVTGAIAARFGWIYGLDSAALVTAVSGLAWFLVDAGKCQE